MTNPFALVLTIIVLGGVCWAVYKLDIKPLFKSLTYLVCGAIAVVLVLDAFGILSALKNTRIPRVDR